VTQEFFRHHLLLIFIDKKISHEALPPNATKHVDMPSSWASDQQSFSLAIIF